MLPGHFGAGEPVLNSLHVVTDDELAFEGMVVEATVIVLGAHCYCELSLRAAETLGKCKSFGICSALEGVIERALSRDVAARGQFVELR